MNTAERVAALCGPHPDRHVGGPGNAAANELFAREASAAGFEIERLEFTALEWTPGPSGAWIELADGERLALHTGPFSPPFHGFARLFAVSTVDELEATDATGAVLLLHSDIAAQQLTPRGYPFYQVAAHQRILAALDAAGPAAVVAATDRTPMAHAVSPFPLFEDGGLGFPSAYLHERDADQLLAHAGREVRLAIDSSAALVRAEQLVARVPGRGTGRVVVSAHIDSRYGTPGALDNATGVAVLLALADRLRDTEPALAVELVPFNGEDDYAAPGELAYLASPNADLAGIVLAVNIDAAARRGDTTALSFYACPDDLRAAVLSAMAHAEKVAEGPEWPMSDHMVFAMRGIPAIALTSSGLLEISNTVAHTAADLPELADAALIEDAADFIAAVIESVGELRSSTEGSTS